jgi:hypothetical protein
MFSKGSKGGPPKAPAKPKRKQRGDKQEQAGGAQCLEAAVSCRGLGLSRTNTYKQYDSHVLLATKISVTPFAWLLYLHKSPIHRTSTARQGAQA